MKNQDALVEMLKIVARALGPELLDQSVFVGGCVVGLLLTDDFSKEQVRSTEDVDLIVDLVNRGEYYTFGEKLAKRGFKENPQEDIICRWKIKNITVDVMPIDASILGFTNRWYKGAVQSASEIDIGDGLKIHVVSPTYFMGTKIEAFRSRGSNDCLTSRDIEDIILLVDGREELFDEILRSESELRVCIANQLIELMANKDFDYAIQSAVNSDNERAQIVFARFKKIADLGKLN